MARRVYVRVVVEYDEAGGVHPLRIAWEDGRAFRVERVLDVRRAAALFRFFTGFTSASTADSPFAAVSTGGKTAAVCSAVCVILPFTPFFFSAILR